MDYKYPASTEEQNLWLPAHTELQKKKNKWENEKKEKKIYCQNRQHVDSGRVETKKKKEEEIESEIPQGNVSIFRQK